MSIFERLNGKLLGIKIVLQNVVGNHRTTDALCS